MLYGHPRFGKTHAIRYVRIMLASGFPTYRRVDFSAGSNRSVVKTLSVVIFCRPGSRPTHGSNIEALAIAPKLLDQVNDPRGLLILFADEAAALSIHRIRIGSRVGTTELVLVCIRLLGVFDRSSGFTQSE